jgi:hypothetical protein
LCEQADLGRTYSDKIINEINDNFTKDMSGKLVWEQNTKKYSNICLYDKPLTDWNENIDMCLLNLYSNPEMKDSLEVWTKWIKQGGYIVAQPYNRVRHPDVVQEIDKLINSGWSVVQSQDSMIVIQKP